MDAGGHPHAASTRPSWHDCTVPSQNSSCNGSNVSTGDGFINNGCKDTYLGSGAVSNGISERKIYPFACKLFHGTRSGTWVDSVNVTNGQIVLDNSIPGTCKYELQCNKDYKAGDSGTSTVSCSGNQCKSLNFNGNATSLITAPCVQDTPTTCPTMQNPDNGYINYSTPTNGTCNYTVTCDNSSSNFGYACDTTTGLCTKSCTVGSDCNNLKSQYTGAQHQLCKRCPTVNDLNLLPGLTPQHITASLSNYNYAQQKCTYSFSCSEGYNGSSVTADCYLNNGTCRQETFLEAAQNMQCTLACPTVEQLGIDDDLAFAHLTALSLGYSNGQCNYRFTCDGGCAGGSFTASCIPGSTCDSEHLGRDLVEGHHCTCASDCPNLYSDLNLQSIMSSLNMYDYQQNGEYYSFVDNMGCGYKFLCLTNYQNSWQPSEVYRCNPTDQNANDYCSRQYFIDQLTPNACTFRCPSVFSQGFDLGDELESQHAELKSFTEVGGDVCRYTLGCKPGYAGGDQTFTCQGVGCTRDWLLENLDNLSCSYRCPTMPNISHGSINRLSITPECRYTVSCDNNDGYFCNDDQFTMCGTVMPCANEEGCNNLYNQYYEVRNDLCVTAPYDLGITESELDARHMESYNLHSINSGMAYYHIYCKDGYKPDGDYNHIYVDQDGELIGVIHCYVGSSVPSSACTKAHLWDVLIVDRSVVECIPD